VAQRHVSTTVKWIRGAVALLVVIGTAVTFLPFLDTNTWWIRYLAFPRVQFSCALAVLLLASLLLPGRLRPYGLATSLVAAISLAVQVWILFPYSPIVSAAAAPTESCPAENRVRLFAVNIQMTNEHDDRLFDEIRATDPDLILAEEVDPWWNEQLQALHDRYPYFKHQVTQNYFGIALLSKLPLISPTVRHLADARDPSIFSGVKLPSGATFGFYGIHPRPPQIGQSSAERDAQIAAAALAISESGAPAILVGDLNATPWSAIVRLAARVGGLLDPRIGRGWYPTWKANATVLRWPLDQVLVGPEFTVGDFRVLPPFGSDHQPVLTTLCYTPGRSQNPPEAEPGDLAEARAAVIAGQNKAAPSPEPAPGSQEP